MHCCKIEGGFINGVVADIVPKRGVTVAAEGNDSCVDKVRLWWFPNIDFEHGKL